MAAWDVYDNVVTSFLALTLVLVSVRGVARKRWKDGTFVQLFSEYISQYLLLSIM